MHRCDPHPLVHHSVNNAHAAAVYCALTGHDRGEIGGGTRPDRPSLAVGSVVGMFRPPATPIPPYVSMPYITKEGAGGPPQPGFFGGLLGRIRDPLFVLRDPNATDFAVPELTSAGRRQRAAAGRAPAAQATRSNEIADGGHGDAAARELTGFQPRALRPADARRRPRRRSRLEHEPDRVRDAYGRNIYGQSVLLARRLIEAGTRVVTASPGRRTPTPPGTRTAATSTS